ncbi:MAG: hypothetical protein ABEJ91_01565 [Candidatus Nanohaloarchaea archaeon]
MNARKHYLEIRDAATYPFSSMKRTVIASSVSILAFLLLVLGSYPEYSFQMLNSQASMLTAVTSLLWNIQQTAGYLGVALTVIYSVATGIALTNAYAILRRTGVRQVGSLGGALPGFLVGSCAGCGAGVLGLLGFAGAISLLPFAGNGIKIVAIGLIMYFLADTGHPETCGVK